jgi:hypothetical protein
VSGSRLLCLRFAHRDRGNGVTRILYTAQGHENAVEAVTVMRDCRSESAGQDTTRGNLGLGGLGIRGLITSKCRRNGRFVQRLIDLDWELYERRANIGARGEPSVEGNSLDRRLHK